MQPESSDGFASVGTILPEERAALLPGGSFRFWTGRPGGRSLFALTDSVAGTTWHLRYLRWGRRASRLPDTIRPTADRGPVVIGVSVRAISA